MTSLKYRRSAAGAKDALVGSRPWWAAGPGGQQALVEEHLNAYNGYACFHERMSGEEAMGCTEAARLMDGIGPSPVSSAL